MGRSDHRLVTVRFTPDYLTEWSQQSSVWGPPELVPNCIIACSGPRKRDYRSETSPLPPLATPQQRIGPGSSHVLHTTQKHAAAPRRGLLGQSGRTADTASSVTERTPALEHLNRDPSAPIRVSERSYWSYVPETLTLLVANLAAVSEMLCPCKLIVVLR